MRKNRNIRRHLTVTDKRGKGSHRMVAYKGKRSTLRKSGDMRPGTIKEFLGQLGIDPRDVF
jgi:hypothetical protein